MSRGDLKVKMLISKDWLTLKFNNNLESFYCPQTCFKAEKSIYLPRWQDSNFYDECWKGKKKEIEIYDYTIVATGIGFLILHHGTIVIHYANNVYMFV